MAWVEIMPGYDTIFRQCGWESAAAFLSWTGILVNRHKYRQVEQVACGLAFGTEPANAKPQAEGVLRFFLKKQQAVSLRERFRNAWAGFGWSATAVREAATLLALRKAGVGCPVVAAFGEDGCDAFVLLREATNMTDLRTFLPTLTCESDRNGFAEALGHELGRMHDAGFEHRDLFAKHILVARDGPTYRFCILDWQRARHRRSLSWHARCRDLAVVDATLMATLASDRLRLRCLSAYWATQCSKPPLARIARQIRRRAEHLRGCRHIREIAQSPVPAHDQQFVPLQGGRLLIVRSFLDELGGEVPDWLSESEAQTRGYTLSFAEPVNADGAWELPPLAHTLFRLQRFGVSAPRLLAVGFSDGGVFTLSKPSAAIVFREALANSTRASRTRMLEQAEQMVSKIQEAGYHLPRGDHWFDRLGFAQTTEDVVLTRVEPMLRGKPPVTRSMRATERRTAS